MKCNKHDSKLQIFLLFLYEVLFIPCYISLCLRSDCVFECLTIYALIIVFFADIYRGVNIVFWICYPISLRCLQGKFLGNKSLQLLSLYAFVLPLFVICLLVLGYFKAPTHQADSKKQALTKISCCVVLPLVGPKEAQLTLWGKQLLTNWLIRATPRKIPLNKYTVKIKAAFFEPTPANIAISNW